MSGIVYLFCINARSNTTDSSKEIFFKFFESFIILQNDFPLLENDLNAFVFTVYWLMQTGYFGSVPFRNNLVCVYSNVYMENGEN